MREKIKSLFITLHSWRIVLLSIIGAVLITDLITALISLWIWHEIQPGLIILGMINASLVPLIILLVILRVLRKIVKLEEQNQINKKTISQLKEQKQIEESAQQRASEMSLLYQLGILMASGKDLPETLLTIYTEILKLIQADVLFIAIYDENTDTINYPIFFEGGKLEMHATRSLPLGLAPGLTGPVVYNKKTLYLMDFRTEEALNKYKPVGDNDQTVHTFLGIPLMVNEKVIGVLSLQSRKIDAYSQNQIHFMENIAVLAALAIDKARLLDQFQVELEERKRIEAGLYERESILEAITFSAEQFLKTPDWREKINAVLERLGKEFNASHAYLFEQHLDENGELRNSLRYEWAAPGQKSDMDNPEYKNAPVYEPEFDRYYRILNNGEPFVGSASFLTEAERDQFLSSGIRALLEMQVRVNGKLWGTIGFDDKVNEREWTVMEVDVIRVAANVLGAAIKRQMDEDALKQELMERRRIEQALRLSEEKFSKAFHTSQVMMTIEDDKNIFIDVNKAFIDSVGFQREDIIGRHASDLNILFAPEDIQKAQKILKEQGTFKNLELRFRQKTEKTFNILMSIEKFHVNDVVYTLTSALDITELKQAEAEREKLISNLQARNAELETLRETTVIVTSTLDISEAVQRILKQLKRVVTYDSASVWLYKGNVAQRIGEDGLPDTAVKDKQYTVEDGEPDYPLWNQELPYVLLDDIQINHARFRIPPIDYVHSWLAIPLKVRGKLTGFISLDGRKVGQFTGRDAQLALNYANQVSIALENARLFSDLQNELNERKKLIDELENKNSELERFTYTVSHDLKSPLVTINGFLGYLEKDARAGNLQRLQNDIQRIQEAVDKMRLLLGDLLELSRIGRLVNVPELIPFEDLAKDALDIVHGQLEESGVTVFVQPDLPVVFGDRQRLVEILQNLIDNASKFMGNQKDPRIEIGQQGEEEGKPVFFVRDNGIGIAPKYHEQVFGLFNKLNPDVEGTGIGLALVKRIIEVHGGRIWVESDGEGRGATFLFTLTSQRIGEEP